MGTQITTAITDWADDALLMVPACIAAGLGMWGVPTLIGFAKRVFGAAR
jgi:hypothetical protein